MSIDARRERYVSLATFRKDGREVRTPVWIAAGDGRAVVYTNVKRIRNNNKVRLAPCTARGQVTGDWQDATAHIVEDPETRDRGIQAAVDKYGWQMRLALLVSRLSGRYDERAIIELEL